MINDCKKGNLLYTFIQVLYWSTYGMMFSYASKFLQNRTFTTAEIGLCMGICYALSALLQPAIANVCVRKKMRLNRAILTVYYAILTLAVLNLALRPGKIGTGVIFTLMAALQSSLQPSVNSLHRGHVLRGIPINFGFARGMGSLVFAIMAYFVGLLLTVMNADLLPVLYITTIVFLMICLRLFESPFVYEAGKKSKTSAIELFRTYPKFTFFFIGVILLAFAHIFIDGFMLQIFQSLGGDTAQQGTGAAIAALTELPAMVLYTKMARRHSCKPWIIIAGWGWAVKNTLIFLSGSFITLYAAMLLQFFAYAVYVPAAVDYIAATLPEDLFLKGQALNGCAFTIGSLLATLVGGNLMDILGVHTSLAVMSLLTVSGAIMFTMAAVEKK